jgi:prepilin-type N-terminal cleavage/methylation domain-containing protein
VSLTKRASGFTILEVLISSSIALLLLLFGYLIFTETLQKGYRISASNDRLTEFTTVMEKLTGDLQNSAPEAVSFFSTRSEQLLAIASVSFDPSQTQRAYSQQPTAYRLLIAENTLYRASSGQTYSSTVPGWTQTALDGFFAPRTTYEIQRFSNLNSLTCTLSSDSVTYSLTAIGIRSDGSAENLNFSQIVLYR